MNGHDISLKCRGGGPCQCIAYTLAEVVITMLIIAVVVSISIKLVKTRLDNITTYSYYAAYSTIKSVTTELLRNYDNSSPNYVFHNKNLFSFLKKMQFLPSAYAAGGCIYEERKDGNKYCYKIKKIPGSCNNYLTKAECQASKLFDECPFEYDYWAYAVKTAGGTESLAGISEVMSLKNNYNIAGVEILAGHLTSDPKTFCSCEYRRNSCSYSYRGTDTKLSDAADMDQAFCKTFAVVYVTVEPDDKPEPDPDPGTDPNLPSVCELTPPENIPCGMQWDNSPQVCGLVPISPWPPACEPGKTWIQEDCDCMPAPQTIPKREFCEEFEARVNSKSLISSDIIDEYCKGDSISDTDDDFSDKKPDIILRNGMRLYNLSQEYVEIPSLEGNKEGQKFSITDGDKTKEIDVNRYGYIIYADIDGASGNGKLWEDVFPFYITLAGAVIPAYDLNNPDLSVGGNAKFYLQMSVLNEKFDTDGRHLNWLAKNVSFKVGACLSGYVGDNSRYCKLGDAVTTNSECLQVNSDCRLKTIMPIKMFGY